jgi:hypothetical protein
LHGFLIFKKLSFVRFQTGNILIHPLVNIKNGGILGIFHYFFPAAERKPGYQKT